MSQNSQQKLQKQRTQQYQLIVRSMWKILLYGIAGIIATFLILSFTDLPDTEELENPKSELASEILFADGTVMGRYFIENRVPVDFDQLSPYLEKALVATEDERYYQHSGIDFQALGRVFFKTILMGDRSSGGASTITQQLAKLLFTGKPGSGFSRVVQKLKEWIIALELERKYTKEEIIAMYLNKFDFLYDSHGIKAAAETYFGKSQDSLKIEEAALLVGMLKNPSLYNPKRKLKVAEQRRMVVLNQMRKNDIITREEYDSLKMLLVDISKFTRKTHTQGLATYFRSELVKELQYDILPGDEARKKPDGSPYNPYKDGLKIYTTLDPAIQKHAEEAMVAHMSSVQTRFWNLWKKRMRTSPWDYKTEKTTEAELRYRKRKLSQMVRTSERYALMRDGFIGTLENDLEAEIEGLSLGDAVIEKIINGKETLSGPEKQAADNEKWGELKQQWRAFQKSAEKAFNKKVKMKVFDWKSSGFEKDTLMSPLDSIKYHHMFMQIGSLAVDPRNGHVKAWVGGINSKYFAFDHTGANRQVGSTFKPFIYATAIAQQGISPCTEVTDMPRTIFAGEGNFDLIQDWTPRNSTDKYTYQNMSLRSALKKSVNTVSVFLMQQLGSVQPVLELMENMGVDLKKIPTQPAICLGAADLTVMDMTGAYTTFANNGYYSKPIYITRIEDKNGRVIYTQEEQERQALQEEPNFVMVEMLKYASGGMGLKSEIGGKTGTTNDYVDGWFMGVTPSLVVGTWVGGEDRWIRFLSIAEGQGSRMAKPFCKEFLQRVEADPKADYDWKLRFTRPQGDLSIGLDCNDFSTEGDDDEASDAPTEGSTPPRESIYEDPFGLEGTSSQGSKKQKNSNGDEDF
jgi:penicillin-binding protein 1A